jgi:hypothetical protein
LGRETLKELIMLFLMIHQLIVIIAMLICFFNGLILFGVCILLYGWAWGSWIYGATEPNGWFERDKN